MRASIPYLIIALLSISIVGAYGWFQHADYLPAEVIDVRVNEYTRGISAELQRKQTLLDSLEARNAELADHITEQEEEIQLSAAIAGRLRLEKDSLEAVLSQPIPGDWALAPLPEGADSSQTPSVLHFKQQFTEGLFEVRSEIYLYNGRVHNTLDLEQLRDLRMNFTITERESGTLVFYSELPDFDLVHQEAYTPATEAKRAWYIRHWEKFVIGGLGAYAVLR